MNSVPVNIPIYKRGFLVRPEHFGKGAYRLLKDCLVAGHLSKGLLELLRDSLQLFLLGRQLILQPVHLLLKLLDGLLSKLGPCFSLAVRVLICSLLEASLWLAFSSDTSRDFRLLATTLNSSSSSTILISPTSARSSVLSRSASVCTSFF